MPFDALDPAIFLFGLLAGIAVGFVIARLGS
jgi:uncharacterized membrane-anchored protein YhcB (DUF1043 family)